MAWMVDPCLPMTLPVSAGATLIVIVLGPMVIISSAGSDSRGLIRN